MTRELKTASKNLTISSATLKELVRVSNSFRQLSSRLDEAYKPAKSAITKFQKEYDEIWREPTKQIRIATEQFSELFNLLIWSSDIKPTKAEVQEGINSLVKEIESQPASPEKTGLVSALKSVKLGEAGKNPQAVTIERVREIIKADETGQTDEEVRDNLAFIEALVGLALTKIPKMMTERRLAV